MEQRTERRPFALPRLLARGMGGARQDTPMTLTPEEVTRVRSLHDRLDMQEVEEIYLPLSRLLSLYVAATQRLFRAQQNFLGTEDAKMPYIIGVAGSVAVGKSTTARVLQALLARWPNVPKVDLLTTDGFLYPNAMLEREGLMEKKGFPESYDLPALLRFLTDIKAGRRPVRAPIYSHLIYDVIPNQWIEVDRPDILIVEGLNVLQTGRPPKDGKAIPYVSDFFDFSIYLDADEEVLLSWYVDRFLTLRGTAFRDPKSYFHRYATLSDEEAVETATSIWTRINLVNLHENILPTRQRGRTAPRRDARGRLSRRRRDRRACAPPAARGDSRAPRAASRRRRRGAARARRGRAAPRPSSSGAGQPRWCARRQAERRRSARSGGARAAATRAATSRPPSPAAAGSGRRRSPPAPRSARSMRSSSGPESRAW